MNGQTYPNYTKASLLKSNLGNKRITAKYFYIDRDTFGYFFIFNYCMPEILKLISRGGGGGLTHLRKQ